MPLAPDWPNLRISHWVFVSNRTVSIPPWVRCLKKTYLSLCCRLSDETVSSADVTRSSSSMKTN